MEEKFNEILLKYELKQIEFEREKNELTQKCVFLKEHGFNKELEWAIHEKQAKMDLYISFRDSLKELRDLLNAWNS